MRNPIKRFMRSRHQVIPDKREKLSKKWLESRINDEPDDGEIGVGFSIIPMVEEIDEEDMQIVREFFNESQEKETKE